MEYPVYLTLCAPRIPLWAPHGVPCEYPKAEYPRECPREYPCEYPCECRSSPLEYPCEYPHRNSSSTPCVPLCEPLY